MHLIFVVFVNLQIVVFLYLVRCIVLYTIFLFVMILFVLILFILIKMIFFIILKLHFCNFTFEVFLVYYIIKDDGSSIFEQPYPFDFCLHCLFNLIDNPDPMLQTCKLVHFEFVRQGFGLSGRGGYPAKREPDICYSLDVLTFLV